MFKTIGSLARAKLRDIVQVRGLPEPPEDPSADEFFTVLNGRPVTYREYNALLEKDFERQRSNATESRSGSGHEAPSDAPTR